MAFCVGVVGFEPTTPWSQTRCASRTALYPEYQIKELLLTKLRAEPATLPTQSGCASRTALYPEYQIKELLLTKLRAEPATLPTQSGCASRTALYPEVFFAVRGGFEPPVPFPVRQFSKLLV